MMENRLTVAIFISASIHLAAAAYYTGWRSQEALQVSSETIGQPLTIAIQQTIKSTPEKNQEKQSEKKQVQKKSRPPISANKSKQISKNKAQPKPEIETQEQNSEKNARYAVQSNHMVKYLSSEFRLRFKYPLLARKRGWQGTVVVGLNVSQKGKITQVAVQQSSGFGVLDRNAVNTFRSIEQLAPELSSNLLRNHQLSIPVIYNLTGG